MSEKLKAKPPQAEAGDHAYTVVKAAVSAIPFAGGPAAELMGMVVAPPLAKRRDQWLEALALGLRDLEEKVAGFKVSDLSGNDSFITSVMHATTAAVKNHQKEKLDALRNAVLNSALPNSPDADLQLMFLGWVDSLTPLHLRVLALLSVPTSWGDWNEPPQPPGTTGVAANVIQHAFPEMRGKRDLCDKVVKDLANDGLIGSPKSQTTTGRSVLAPQTTDIGKRFLAFIAPPAY